MLHGRATSRQLWEISKETPRPLSQPVPGLSHPHSTDRLPDVLMEPPGLQSGPLPLVLALGSTENSLAPSRWILSNGGKAVAQLTPFPKAWYQYLKDELTVLQGQVFSVISVGMIQIFLDRSENCRLTEWSVNTQTKVKLLCTDICFQLCKET